MTEQTIANAEPSEGDVQALSEALYAASLEEILGVADEALDDVARVVLTSGWLRERMAQAWERGHFYCAAEQGTDARCTNPYRSTQTP